VKISVYVGDISLRHGGYSEIINQVREEVLEKVKREFNEKVQKEIENSAPVIGEAIAVFS
jgi:hypothetical protein